MKQDKLFRRCVIGLFLLVLVAYSNHFGNSFHFDDSHCINDNAYVRSLSNIPQFFKSAKTFSSLPYNQMYRPMLTTLYTIDYALGDGAVGPFHIFIFLFFILQGIVMYLLVIKVFDSSFQSASNKYFALFTVGWYMVSTANSDTINYISSSSDSISTFWVVLGLVMYIYKPELRKYMLYLVPVIIGTLFKQAAIIFPALLAVYVFLFEKREELNSVVKRLLHTVITILPALVLCFLLYVLQAKLTPNSYVNGGNPFNYLITQPYVILHYFITFYFPFGLSADSDWIPLTSMATSQFILGILFVVALIGIIFSMMRQPKYFPIAFGIAWFLAALIPTTVVPLAEVMNDHRAFFPYIGIAIASGWQLFLFWEKLDVKYVKTFKGALILILVLNAAGTFARNFVWNTEETLWHDVTIKSPGNGRGQMNYGLTLMNKGDYKGAEMYFTKALELMPYYSYANENMAILKAYEKQNVVAEKYYKQALEYDPGIPILHYYYGKFLHEQNRDPDAETQLQLAINLSPADIYSRYLLMDVYQSEQNWPALIALANQTLVLLPGDATTKTYLANSLGKKTKLQQALDVVAQHPSADNYLALSLVYYNQKEYQKCIEASEEALKLDKDYYLAYNNIGSAYNMTGDWQKAMDAFTKALKLKPDFEIAKNNFNYSVKQIAITDSMNNVVAKKPIPENYLSLSLMYYRQNLFEKSVQACKQAIKIDPSYTLAYNNMCAAYNSMAKWDSAIDAGINAMRLEPNNQLVKNNLAEARRGKEASKN